MNTDGTLKISFVGFFPSNNPFFCSKNNSEKVKELYSFVFHNHSAHCSDKGAREQDKNGYQAADQSDLRSFLFKYQLRRPQLALRSGAESRQLPDSQSKRLIVPSCCPGHQKQGCGSPVNNKAHSLPPQLGGS